jgi:hypothetical protein
VPEWNEGRKLRGLPNLPGPKTFFLDTKNSLSFSTSALIEGDMAEPVIIDSRPWKYRGI